MRITRIEHHRLVLPQGRAKPLPMAGRDPQSTPSLLATVVEVHTDTGHIGLGYAPVGSRALSACIEDELAPKLVGADPLHHERLASRLRGSEAGALLDIALWDLKAKAAGLPLWRLLGGARDSARAFCGDTAAAHLSTEELLAIGRSAVNSGLMGVRVSIQSLDPEAESQKIIAIRDALGEDPWFGVTVEGRFDYETALPMGRFLEEETGADWFENSLDDHDLSSWQRLSSRIDTPLAIGSRFTDPQQFVRVIESGAKAVFRPDPIRLGGLTALLKVATLAELYHRPLVPNLLPEVGLHLACGLPGVQAFEYVAALSPLFRNPIEPGSTISPPAHPGLGFELDREALARFRQP